MRLPSLFAALAISLALGAPALAQEASLGGIRGRVVDAADGSGMEGVEIDLDGVLIHAGRQTKSGPNGLFSFDGLAPGNYSVRAYPDGYLPSPPLDVVVDATGGKGIILHVQRLSAIATFSGIVRDGDDKPVTNARVCVERRYFDDFGTPVLSADQRVCAMTNAEGRYTTDKLDPGSYLIEAFPAGSYANTPVAGTFHPAEDDLRYATVVVIKDRPITGVDIRTVPHPVWTVRGEINSDLPAYVSVGIKAYRNGRSVYTSNAELVPGSGKRTFTIPGLSDGAYDIVAIAEGLAISDDPAKLRPGMAGSAHVEVRGADVSDVGMFLDADVNLRVISLSPGKALDPSLLQTQATGVIRMSNIMPGSRLYALSGSDDGVQVFRSGDALPVRMLSDGTVIPISVPLPEAPLPTFVCHYGTSSILKPIPDRLPRYSVLKGLHHATCLFEIEKLPADAYVDSAKLDGEDIWDRVFTPSSSASNLVVTLAEGAGIVSGHIVDEQGNIFPKPTTVILVPVMKPGDHPSAEIHFQVGATGSFDCGNIRPGGYHLLAFDGLSDTNLYNNTRLLDELETRGASVVLKEGSRETAEVTVIHVP